MKMIALLFLALALTGPRVAEPDERDLPLVLRAAGDARPGTGLRFYCNGRAVIVAFIVGPNNGRSMVDLEWRFDGGPAHYRRVHWLDGAYGIYLPDWGEFLAPSLYASELTVQIDQKNTMHFDLAAAREELAEFDSGCGL